MGATSGGSRKRIMVSCGMGIVTSAIARARIEDLLDAHGYADAYDIAQVPLDEAPARSHEFDFAVTTIAPSELHCPCVNGVPYLMGTGTDASDAEILRHMEG